MKAFTQTASFVLLLFLNVSAFASLPEFPSWSSDRYFQLDSEWVIDGVRVDTLEFVWPTHSGATSGAVRFGRLFKGEWENSKLELRWELISFGRVRIKTEHSGELEIGTNGKLSWDSRVRPEENFTEIARLQALDLETRYSVGRTIDYNPSSKLGFIELSRTVEIDGAKINVVQFDRYNVVRYFSRAADGTLIDSGKSGLYDAIVGYMGRYIYFGVGHVGGPTWELDRHTRQVVSPDKAQVSPDKPRLSYTYLEVGASRTFKVRRAKPTAMSCERLFKSVP